MRSSDSICARRRDSRHSAVRRGQLPLFADRHGRTGHGYEVMARAHGWILIALIAAGLLSSEANAALSGTSAALTAPAARPKALPKVPARREASTNAFDGGWSVRSTGGCVTSGSSFVAVTQGRIRGEGLSGSIDANGNVRTVGRAGSLSVVSSGRATGNSAAGVFRENTGCSGTWTAQRR